MRSLLKSSVHWASMVAVAPFGLACCLESRLGVHRLFQTFVHAFAVFPGLPGMILRRAFYCWTLTSCASECHIGFGVLINSREAVVHKHAYLGDYALVGRAVIGERALIGSRASLLSGGRQHERTEDGRWTVGEGVLTTIEIGQDVWIGESACVLASIGRGAMISAGAVVSAPVDANVMMAGNPARFVKRFETVPDKGTPPTQSDLCAPAS